MTELGPDATLSQELEELAQVCEAEDAKLTASMLTRASDRIGNLELVLHSLHMYAKTAVDGGPVHPALKPMLDATVETLKGHN